MGGHPNWRAAQVILPTTLNVDHWRKEVTGHHEDDDVIRGILYGYPIQYTGGPRYDSLTIGNHPSAKQHPSHIREYLEEETELGAIAGPFTKPPFAPWYSCSPIMTREKPASRSRRIIVDLSFPDGGVNSMIHRNRFHSRPVCHKLPTITDALEIIVGKGRVGVVAAIMDLSRAYRHFAVCPLDWPLLMVGHDGNITWTEHSHLAPHSHPTSCSRLPAS